VVSFFPQGRLAMPANLPPQYFKAEEEYKSAKTLPEKIAALEAMMAVMPHHKGTDKLRAQHTRHLSQLREQLESGGKGKRSSIYHIEKQGAAQTILVGPPNAGKSSILASLTHAAPHVADYPYTTAQPEIGMMPYRDIQIQIIDLPPTEGDVRKLPFYNLLRTTDALVFVVDASGEPDAEVLLLVEELADGKVFTPLFGSGDLPVGGVRARALVALNKADAADAPAAAGKVREAVSDRIRVVAVSARDGTGIEALKDEIYGVVEIVRVYTKVPGKKADLGTPFVLARGSTVMDLAREIHRDFAEGFRFARIWGSGRFDGQSVERDHALEDGDVIELHL
jgi:ribosome-interacting GTPase 1